MEQRSQHLGKPPQRTRKTMHTESLQLTKLFFVCFRLLLLLLLSYFILFYEMCHTRPRAIQDAIYEFLAYDIFPFYFYILFGEWDPDCGRIVLLCSARTSRVWSTFFSLTRWRCT